MRLCVYAFGRPCVNALLRLGVSASDPGGVVLGCSLGLEPRARAGLGSREGVVLSHSERTWSSGPG